MENQKIKEIKTSQNAHSLVASMLSVPSGGKKVVLDQAGQKTVVRVTTQSRVAQPKQ